MIDRKKKENAIVPGSSRGNAGSEITSRDPLGLWTDMDRLFNNFRSNFDDLFWMPAAGGVLPHQQFFRAPLMDVEDLGKEYRITLDMPGIRKEDLELEVGRSSIELSARTAREEEETGRNYIRKERGSASLYRALEFPEEIVPEGVDAKMENGVLAITLPKKEPRASEKRKVQVK